MFFCILLCSQFVRVYSIIENSNFGKNIHSVLWKTLRISLVCSNFELPDYLVSSVMNGCAQPVNILPFSVFVIKKIDLVANQSNG